MRRAIVELSVRTAANSYVSELVPLEAGQLFLSSTPQANRPIDSHLWLGLTAYLLRMHLDLGSPIPWFAPVIPIGIGSNGPCRSSPFRTAFLRIHRRLSDVCIYLRKRIQVRMKFDLLISLFLVVFLAACAWGESPVVRGRQYYLSYCASCHGIDADGRGPMASLLKASPSDLRHLRDRYGMPLPIGTIARFIDGRRDVAAHGPRDMPVWGRRFYDVWTAKQSSERDLQVQIREIVQYLNAIQQEPIPSEGPLLPKK